jgi:uncharacterized protein (TIGR03083 family)
LRSSVNRLTGLVEVLDDEALSHRAYPADWTIADVIAHLGSGAVISQRRMDDTLAVADTPEDFNQGVWDQWNAKSARAKAADGLAAINSFTSRLESVSDQDRARFRLAMGPMEVGWNAFVSLRLNESLLHEWDVAVVRDTALPLADDGTAVVIDNLELIARFSAEPIGEPRTVTIATTDPIRRFAVTVDSGGVTLFAAESEPDLLMPAESLIRLVYGRLDPDHTPATVTGDAAALEQLRTVFTGP